MLAALAGVLAFGIRIECPVGHIDARQRAPLAGVILQRVGRKPQAAQPVGHSGARLALIKGEGQQSFGFYMAVRARVRDHGRGTKTGIRRHAPFGQIRSARRNWGKQ